MREGRSVLARLRLTTTAMVLGALVGGMSFAAHQPRSDPWATLGGMGALWLAGSFAIGQRSEEVSSAAIRGLVFVETAVAAYYFAEWEALGRIDAITVETWIVCGVISGPLVGVAGYFGVSRTQRWRWISGLVLAAVFLLEGLVNLRAQEPDAISGLWIEIALAFVVPLALVRTAGLSKDGDATFVGPKEPATFTVS